MANTRFCAFNKTRGIILSLDVAVLDAAQDPLRVLRVLMEGLDSEDSKGLWLTHFRAVPVARAVSPFDLIYLDANHCVVHAVALTVDSGFEPFNGEPSSALVMPTGTILTAQMATGDQLVIVATPEADIAAKTATPMLAAAPAPAPIAGMSRLAVPAPLHAVPAADNSGRDPGDAALSRFLTGRAHLPAEQPMMAAPMPATPPAPRVTITESAPVQRPPIEPLRVEMPAPAQMPAEAAEQVAAALPIPDPPAVEYYHEPLPSFRTRVLRWLKLQHPALQDSPNRRRDRRRAYRLNRPDLVAYFFTGGTARPNRIENISVTGFLMQSDDLWAPGTIIRMTLQKTGSRGDQPGDAVTVHSRMVRRTPVGGAFEFVLSGFLDNPYRRAAS